MPTLSFIELGVIKEVANLEANNAFTHVPPPGFCAPKSHSLKRAMTRAQR
jgi:hypothetical protein